MVDGWGISCEIAYSLMSTDLSDDKSTLVQVMAWRRQAKCYHLCLCWPRFVSSYGVIRAQWFRVWASGKCQGFQSVNRLNWETLRQMCKLYVIPWRKVAGLIHILPHYRLTWITHPSNDQAIIKYVLSWKDQERGPFNNIGLTSIPAWISN